MFQADFKIYFCIQSLYLPYLLNNNNVLNVQLTRKINFFEVGGSSMEWFFVNRRTTESVFGIFLQSYKVATT